jgi:hypothetical protein
MIMLPALASAQLKINEIMSNNVSSSMDDKYNYSMWVEVFNAGSTAVNLNGYVFQKKLTADATLWSPGNVNVPAGGFTVLYFERPDEFNPGHATIKLDPTGGTLYLTKDGAIVDELAYPQQYRNSSYGRKTDGGNEFAYFAEPSKGASNNGKATAETQAAKPVFSTAAGFYTGTVEVSFEAPEAGTRIYYTTTTADAYQTSQTEPSNASTLYNGPITLSKTTVVRAIAVSNTKLPSDIATSTFFVNERQPTLPVISITTDGKNLFDNQIGIYVTGTNGQMRYYDGVPQNFKGAICTDVANWNRPWDRPANFEYFDASGAQRLSQELDIAISGQCSRRNDPKSLKIKPKNKYGNNHVDYDFFPDQKPGHRYTSLLLRVDGTEGPQDNSTYFRDALTQSLYTGNPAADIQAYQPAIVYINGQYYGLDNIRERTNADFLYSNYGLDEDDVTVLEMFELVYTGKNAVFNEMYNFIKNNNLSDDAKYEQAASLLDIDNFIDAITLELYAGNWDYPANNVKVWKKKEGGKWRFFLYDLDFSFDNMAGICGGMSFNKIANGGGCDNEVSTIMGTLFKQLCKSEKFKQRLITRYTYHVNTTFASSRVIDQIDKYAARIRPEWEYHCKKWSHGSNGTATAYDTNVEVLRNFAKNRPAAMINDLRSYFSLGDTYSVSLASNVENPLFIVNGVEIDEPEVKLSFFKNQDVTIEAARLSGFDFERWVNTPSETLIPTGSEWNYWDGNGQPEGWPTSDGASWKKGVAPLGYASSAENEASVGKSVGGTASGNIATGIGFGGNGSKKYPTAYFSKKVNITDVDKKSGFRVFFDLDDAGIVYVNGQEVGRSAIAAGCTPSFNLIGDTYSDMPVYFDVPASYFVEGENLITAEVHQTDGFGECRTADGATSSDLYFELALTCTDNNEANATTVSTDRVYTKKIDGDLTIRAVYTAGEAPKKIYINEINGNNPDWIELYNAETTAVDLSGYILSKFDDAAVTYNWTIPAGTTISAGGYLLLQQYEDFEYGIAHDRPGTYTLTDNGRAVLDVFTIEPGFFAGGCTFGRLTDGSPELALFIWGGTPGATNNGHETTTGIKALTAESVKVYPNPVSDRLTVETPYAIRNITVTDISGRAIIRVEESGVKSATISTDRLAKGIYMLSVETEEGKTAKKIVKI